MSAIHDFPPEPAGSDLIHTILSNACYKMLPINIQEAGCAVCGELKLI